jgi:DNA invertase Pin-like site-specific DNA recombinase
MAAVAYVRVSTDKQAEKGFSLEVQVEKVRAMAVVQGVDLSEVIVDRGESAKNLDRPGMAHLLDLVNRKAIDRVIVAKLDRLTRSVKDLANLLETFEKRRVALVSVAESLDTQSAAGRLVLNIMVSVSAWEREAIGERTAAVLQHKKRERQVFNHTPYGFQRCGSRLTADEREQATIRRVFAAKAQGRSLREIASALNADGVATKTRGTWHASTVSNILNNSLHEGAA